MKYKKTFYFENNDSFKIKCESDLDLRHFAERYINAFNCGSVVAEVSKDEINIIDLKKVQLINIKEVKDE